MEENTGGLHYCQLEPFDDDPPLKAGDVSELESLHAQAKALFRGFLGPFKVLALCLGGGQTTPRKHRLFSTTVSSRRP